MNAIIVPGITDLNKGDQALVWESYRILRDTNLYDRISVLSNGDTDEEQHLLCDQTREKGFVLIPSMLKHPRRGIHRRKEVVRESLFYRFFQLCNASLDYVSGSLLIFFVRNKGFIRIFYNKKIAASIAEFKKADVIFVKGGGFIHSYGERSAPYKIWYHLFYIKLAKRLKKKVIVLPNSYGPFEGFSVKHQIKRAFNGLDLILARESVSAERLSDLISINVPVSPDLAFYLNSSTNDIWTYVSDKYKLDSTDKLIGVTIRPWRFPGSKYSDCLYENYINSIKELAIYLSDNGYKVVFFNQSLGPNSHEDDRNAISYLYGKIGKDKISLFTWIDENLNCEDLKALYSHLFFFIGTRFHSVIFSISSLVPSIAIAYGGNKAIGIMQDINLKRYVIPINEVDPSVLIDKFNDALLNYSRIKETLSNKMKTIEMSRIELINGIKKISS